MLICRMSLSLQQGVSKHARHQGDHYVGISKSENEAGKRLELTRGTRGRTVACLLCHRGLAPRRGPHGIGSVDPCLASSIASSLQEERTEFLDDPCNQEFCTSALCTLMSRIRILSTGLLEALRACCTQIPFRARARIASCMYCTLTALGLQLACNGGRRNLQPII